jgi:SAM-dependent methyltransferase
MPSILARVAALLRWLRGRAGRAIRPARWHDLRRIEPHARHYGAHRGTPVDRIYIAEFLAQCGDDIRGTVLEVASGDYARRFGDGRVERCEVVSLTPDVGVTIVGDLTSPSLLGTARFDCIILTQTLQFIYDTRAVLDSCYAALKPGGVLLVTVPGISQSEASTPLDDFWRYTSLSLDRLLTERFSAGQVTVQSYGNVLSAVSLLHGIAAEELAAEELAHFDRDYELIVAGRAVKTGLTNSAGP